MLKKGAVLVTGCSSGIGKELALLLDRNGYRVFAGVRKKKDAEALGGEASERLVPILMDVTNGQQISNAVLEVEQRLEPGEGLYGLVNNAGICVAGPLELVPVDDLRRLAEVNFVGPIAVTQAFLPLLRRFPQGRPRGRIVNVGSATGVVVLPFIGAYSASKSTLWAVSDAFRRELHAMGLSVSLVVSGTVDTPIWDKAAQRAEENRSSQPPERVGLYTAAVEAMSAVLEKGRRHSCSSADVAEVVYNALTEAHPKGRYWVGLDAHLAAINKWVPLQVTDWIMTTLMSGKRSPIALLGWSRLRE